MLKTAMKDLHNNNPNFSPRRIEAYYNSTRARARFLLKDIADEKDAAAIIKFYNIMVRGYSDNTIEPRDILDIGADECYKLLAEIIAGVTIAYTYKELLRNACSKNNQLSKYIKSGIAPEKHFDKGENRRARNVYERLLERHREIIIVLNPITLQIPITRVQSDESDADRRGNQNPKSNDLSTNQAKSYILWDRTGRNANNG